MVIPLEGRQIQYLFVTQNGLPLLSHGDPPEALTEFFALYQPRARLAFLDEPAPTS
jgi:hypothetical protein